MAERLLLQNLLEMWPLELPWSLLSGVLKKTVHGVMSLHYNIAERVCQGKLLVVGYFWPPVPAGARSWRSCPHWRSCAQMQLPSAREATHAAEVWRWTNQPALQSWVVGEPASCKSQMLVKTSLVREPGTGEAASGACLENRLQPGRKTPPFWCLSSALYWQGLTSCWLRKENCLKGSDRSDKKENQIHQCAVYKKPTINIMMVKNKKMKKDITSKHDLFFFKKLKTKQTPEPKSITIDKEKYHLRI